jgi:hypothetical protein
MSNRIFISSVQRERQAVREFVPGDARLDQKPIKPPIHRAGTSVSLENGP